MEMTRGYEGGSMMMSVLRAFLCLLCVCHVSAQTAKNAYYMDSITDCNLSGFMLLNTDDVVNVNSRRAGSSSSEILRCTLRLRPKDDRNILDVSFSYFTMADKDVTLRVTLTGSETYTLTAGSSKPARMSSTGGQVTILLTRTSLDDTDYSFGIIVRAYKEEDTVAQDESPVGVELVVGIIAGVIIFLVFVAIFVVCCYRRQKQQYSRGGPDDYKADLTTTSSSPNHRFGLDNVARNGTSPPRRGQNFDDNNEPSPPVKKKLLNSHMAPSEQSGSESDAKEAYIINSYDRSPTKSTAVKYESENTRRDPRLANSQRGRGRREEDVVRRREDEAHRRREEDASRRREEEANRRREEDEARRQEEEETRREVNSGNRTRAHPPRSPIVSALHSNPRFRASYQAAEDDEEEHRQGRRRPRQEGEGRRDDNSQSQSQGLPPKSPILSALHSNPRFRASFHATEEEAEERMRHVGRGGHDDAGNELDVSMTETWNTTFDTNFDDDPRPPQQSFVKPPSLPPVPKSPKLPLRRENTASIRRAPRPTSSSSEIEQLQAGEGGEVLMNPEGEGPPSPSEIVAIRVQDPHSPSIKRKADAQHTLRPDRSKGKDSAKQGKKSSDARKAEAADSVPKPSKRGADKPKAKAGKVDQPETSGRAKEAKSKPSEGAGKPTDLAPEYEGRFKKSDSARKSKSKSPRIGRSRSTGTALEDSDSIGRPTMPSGYRAVPHVTADDYEDSDMESNYNPLRRTGSKNSLYASRSSLYARRRRKNSAGESVYSYAHDDMDFNGPDRDSFKDRSLSRRDRAFRSLGDLEVELRDQASRSTQTLRECATQTGAGFANVSPGKKTVVKRSKPRSVNSSQTQTAKSKSRNLDSSSSSSGITRPRERKNSASSASGRSKSKDRKNSASGRPKKAKSETELKELRADDHRRPGTAKPKPKKPQGGSTGQLSDDDDLESVRTGMTGPLDQSSVLGGRVGVGMQPLNPAMMGQQPMYPPQGYPGYPVGYPPQAASYMAATGQPPVMMSFGPQPSLHTSAAAPNPATIASAAMPGSAPKPSKWEMLCRMTDGDSAKGGDSFETGSVAGSVFSNPYGAQHFPPGYSSAMSDYAGSERSGPTRSVTGRSQSSRAPGRSAWDTLKEMTDQEYAESQYAASESNV